ncbi:MAG: MATE family efflux transporter [Gemmatimonadota bacterium]
MTAGRILQLAWPIVLANSAVPLLGLVDTAVIGNTGRVEDLGGISLGALVFNFVFWGFGFLRMGTTGFTAQAAGRDDSAEVRAVFARALLMAGGLGVLLLIVQVPLARGALALLGASSEVEALTRDYFDIRIWAAPASLGLFSVMGSLVGLGRTRQVLLLQFLLNGLNAGLDVLLAGVLDLGVQGIALGTAVAEWITFLAALAVLARVFRRERTDREPWWPLERIRDRARGRAMLVANGDILVRTLFLLLGFAWFTNQGALFGDDILAANHVLLQLVSLSAYLLDGYAHATEILVGRAVGSGASEAFDRAVRLSTGLSAASAVVLAILVLLGGPTLIRILTDLAPVRAIATDYLPWTATYILVSFAAFQLDGIFIGATGTPEMRNASIVSFFGFLILSLALVPVAGNTGLWIAFVLFVLLRAVALGVRLPSVRRARFTGGSVGGA